MSKILKNFCYATYVLLAVIILLEVSTQIFVRMFRQDIITQQEQEDNFRLNMVQDWDANFKAAPYFGYVQTKRNNYGFQSTQNFPIKRNDNTYVIAIIGGSVANNFGTHIDMDSSYKDLLKKNVPALKDKDIQFMNLAIPGHKQPQQFIILSYFIDQFDYFIQLDGWNEAWIRTSHQFPADYPAFSELFYSNQQIGKKLDILLAKKSVIDILKKNSVLNKSMTIALIRNALQDDWNKLSEKLLVNNEAFFYNPPKTEEELKEISIQAMVKYLKLEKDLLKAYNKKAYFFIQPSQYNPNSKPFSDLEKRIAFSPAKNSELNTWAFQRVREEATKSGSTDLAMVFKNEPDSVYVDDCCHLNKKGNQIMAEEIFRVVSNNLK